MIKKIGLGILAVIVLFLGYVAMQPSHYRVARSVMISAPAEKIFPYLNNSKLSNEWSPWAELDPTAKMTFSGPDAGVGSRTDWVGGKQLGTGSATIAESAPLSKVRIKLEYTEPFKMVQDAYYTLETQGIQTNVTWSVEGENVFFGRVMCFFSNMDKMVGGTFEKGLAKLKNITEK